VVFLDTAGVDDVSALSEKRLQRTAAVFDRADVVVLLVEPDRWTAFEDRVLDEAARRNLPAILVVNKTDVTALSGELCERVRSHAPLAMECSCVEAAGRERYVHAFKERLLRACPEELLRTPALAGDLVPAGGLVVLIVPIDLQAPKGRLILPQVQMIRDVLDNDAAALVVKEREYAALLGRLNRVPDLVICDSQVVLKMVADTPPGVPCTTFSILFARYKGDLVELARGAAAIHGLREGDRVLIGEACTHHALEDDIGRVKIPRWLRQFAGTDLCVESCAGRDYPANLSDYRLVVHCGSCMLTRREMLGRIQRAREAGVPLTNYGLAISLTQGVLERVLSPFPAALEAYRDQLRRRPSRSTG